MREKISLALFVVGLLHLVLGRSPNIIWIMTDDMGYGEISAFGQKHFRTPNIDRLAAQGIRFTSAYAGVAVCAPSRYALMTGIHMGHGHIRGNRHSFLRHTDVTVAELLRKAGYYTAHVGKWGLGDLTTAGAPQRQGYNYYYGELTHLNAHNMYPQFLHESRPHHPSHLREIPLTGNIPGPIQGVPVLPSQLSHDATGLCVDVEGGNDATEGSALILAPCLNLPELQEFNVLKPKLASIMSEAYVGRSGAAFRSRFKQTWMVDEATGVLFNANSVGKEKGGSGSAELCVAVQHTDEAVRSDTTLRRCNADEPSQQWELDLHQRIRSKHSGQCLSLTSQSSPSQRAGGTPQVYLHLQECEDTRSEQTFHFILDAPSRERCMTPLMDAAGNFGGCNYTHDLFTERALDFIRERGALTARAAAAGASDSVPPFFLYFCWTDPHAASTRGVMQRSRDGASNMKWKVCVLASSSAIVSFSLET